jgi:hypothetical protein
MYVYIYIYIYMCVCVCVCVFMYVCMYVHVEGCTEGDLLQYADKFAEFRYVCICIYVCVYVCVHMCMYVCVMEYDSVRTSFLSSGMYVCT